MPAATPQPPEWIDAAPIMVEESVEIDVAPSAVWPHIADHERWPEWFEVLDDATVTLGATGTDGGRKVKSGPLWFEEEFTAWDEARHFAFTIVRTNLFLVAAMAESVRLEPLDGGSRTQVVYRQGLEGRPGMGRVLSSVWGRTVPNLRTALGKLSERAET